LKEVTQKLNFLSNFMGNNISKTANDSFHENGKSNTNILSNGKTSNGFMHVDFIAMKSDYCVKHVLN
jgi:hypothetical protein